MYIKGDRNKPFLEFKEFTSICLSCFLFTCLHTWRLVVRPPNSHPLASCTKDPMSSFATWAERLWVCSIKWALGPEMKSWVTNWCCRQTSYFFQTFCRHYLWFKRYFSSQRLAFTQKLGSYLQHKNHLSDTLYIRRKYVLIQSSYYYITGCF